MGVKRGRIKNKAEKFLEETRKEEFERLADQAVEEEGVGYEDTSTTEKIDRIIQDELK